MTAVCGQVCSCTKPHVSSVIASIHVPRRRPVVPTRAAAQTTTLQHRATAMAPGLKDLAARVKVCLVDDDDDTLTLILVIITIIDNNNNYTVV